MRLEGGIGCRQEIAGLIDGPGKGSPQCRRGDLVQIGRNYPPCPLNGTLHQEGPRCNGYDRSAKPPERENEQGSEGGIENRPPPSDPLRKSPEKDSPENRPNIVKNCNRSHRARSKPSHCFQKGRIEILGSMAKEVEGRHEQNGEEGRSPEEKKDSCP